MTERSIGLSQISKMAEVVYYRLIFFFFGHQSKERNIKKERDKDRKKWNLILECIFFTGNNNFLKSYSKGEASKYFVIAKLIRRIKMVKDKGTSKRKK